MEVRPRRLMAYNVRTRRKEPIKARQPPALGVYLCGLTVYDHAHIGHARTAVAFEAIRRWLERGFEVRFVQNVTDVDDKIIQRAKELGVSPREHAAKWDAICATQMQRLGVRAPDEAPHVTDSIADIIGFIEAIVANGYAYATDAGNVYFDVERYDAYARSEFPRCAYGSLSNRDFREMAAGTRKSVEVDKRHPADFALWKRSSDDDHPDASWDSPWGPGRPGWHIECSLMATRALGDQVDVHGGGQDLVFPHHENEVAQSQAKTGKAPFVETWIHTGFLNVEGEKMSKSLGNFIALADLLDELEVEATDPEVLRVYFLMTHYRSKIDYSRKGLQEAATAVQRLNRLRTLLHAAATRDDQGDLDEATRRLAEDAASSLDDDFHTPGALAALFTFQRAANQALDAGLGGRPAREALAVLESVGRVLTLFAAGLVDADETVLAGLGKRFGVTGPDVIEQLLAMREEARKGRDFATADAVRDALEDAGFLIEDTPAGPRWSKRAAR